MVTGENEYDIALARAYLGEETIAYGGDMTCWTDHKQVPEFLVCVMNSPYGIGMKSQLATGKIIVHISNSKLGTIQVPLPPIEEQKRIVERLDTLLPLCDDIAKMNSIEN